jgi:hypothetical protein
VGNMESRLIAPHMVYGIGQGQFIRVSAHNITITQSGIARCRRIRPVVLPGRGGQAEFDHIGG